MGKNIDNNIDSSFDKLFEEYIHSKINEINKYVITPPKQYNKHKNKTQIQNYSTNPNLKKYIKYSKEDIKNILVEVSKIQSEILKETNNSSLIEVNLNLN